MGYSDTLNQIYHLIHYAFAFILIAFAAPLLVFSKVFKNSGDQWVSNFIRSIFMVIILGYVLVLTKLYEVITLVIIFIVILIIVHRSSLTADTDKHSIFRFVTRFFDMLDQLILFKEGFIGLWKKCISGVIRFAKAAVSDKERLFKYSLLLLVFGYSFFIRFYDAWEHAAPPLSDSYVTLAWMKYINGRVLFHDGIYPQGFHIYLATMLKFAAIDALYILKYTGALNAFLIVLGFYYTVKKTTGNYLAGLTAALIYGWLGKYILYGDLERQVGTNSQEFAFLFIFPTIYFFILYFETKERPALITGFLGLSVIGLVHSLAFAYVGIAFGCLLLVQLVLKRKRGLTPSLKSAGWACLSVIISLIPLVIGQLMGDHVHSSSAEYLTASTSTTTEAPFGPLHVIDYMTLACFPLYIVVLFLKNMSHKQKVVSLFSLFIGIAFFLLYFAGGRYSHSVLISSRSLDLWALTVPFCLGVGVFNLMKLLPFITKRHIQPILASLLILWAAVFVHPTPIKAYKMERDVQVEQYLKISSKYTTMKWMIVSQQEGYAQVLGKGVHMYLSDFVKRYDPNKRPLTKMSDGKIDRNVPNDVFVFHEKRVFKVPKSLGIYSILESNYSQRERDNENFKKWFKKYKSYGYPYEIVYKDNNLEVYHFHIPEPKEKMKKRFWEK